MTFLRLFYLGVCLSPWSELRAEGCELQLREKTYIREGSVRFSDLGTVVCDVKTSQDLFLKNADSLVLARMFPLSPPVFLRTAFLQSKWDQLARQPRLVLQGPKQIIVYAGASSQDADLFQKKVEQAILENVEGESETRIEFRNFPQGVILPKEDWHLEFDLSRLDRGSVLARVYSLGRLMNQYTIAFEFFSKEEVLTARSDLLRGTALDAEKLSLSEQWITQNIHPLDDAENLEDLVLKRSIKAGEILKQADVTRRRIVTNQQKLKGYFQSGSMTLEMEVMALQSGSRDDTIMVLNPLTQKKYSARILSAEKVEILR